MSEYQYFEFRLDGKTLEDKEKKIMASLSSRAIISSDMASYTYNYGDFRGNPKKLLEKHFDAFLYLANWGSKQLIFKLPKSLVSIKELRQYEIPDFIEVYSLTKEVIVNIDFCEDEPSGGWLEGEGWLPSLLPLRKDILRGDYRVFYLAYLKVHAEYETTYMNKEIKEPPIPPGLNELSPSHQDFIELFEIDRKILTKKSKNSPKMMKSMSKVALKKAIKSLDEDEKSKFLLKLLEDNSDTSIEFYNALKKRSL